MKAQSYRRIESLRAYVLVAQGAPFLEVHERQPDNRWQIREVEWLENTLALAAIGIDLPLSEIYDRVDFAAVDTSRA